MQSQQSSIAEEAKARYSTSVEYLETIGCLLINHLIRLWQGKIKNPKVIREIHLWEKEKPMIEFSS